MKSRGSHFFQGRWLVTYGEREYSFQDIWTYLQQVDQQLVEENRPYELKVIVFKKGLAANTGCSTLDAMTGERKLHLSLVDGSPFTVVENNGRESRGDVEYHLSRPLSTVTLAMPFLSSDPRWDTLEVSSSALFLGSALANRGYEVQAVKVGLPLTSISRDLWDVDMIGFTLFEDLLPPFFDLIQHPPWRTGDGRPLLAAGGPLVTLNPLQAVYHLPEINLFLRGEGEMVLADILDAIKTNLSEPVLRPKGLLFHQPGLILISDFHRVNRPRSFAQFTFNFKFLEPDQLAHGLEINLSRGCTRSCLFCSKVQGNKVRKLPLKKIEALLNEWRLRLKEGGIESDSAVNVNINDDDLLQDRDYAEHVFELMKVEGYRLWGIQTSLNSFLGSDQNPIGSLIDMIDDPELFVNGRPLLWLGTDVFLPSRARRLGKGPFDRQVFRKLVHEFERRKIDNYHYWISSDYSSDWPEFYEEFTYLYSLLVRHGHFGLLPHSPFVIPYPSTPLFRLLMRSEGLKKQVILRQELKAPGPGLGLPLIDRVETRWPHFNQLLSNTSLPAGRGFFDALKERDYLAAFQTFYSYLKLDRLQTESENRALVADRLKALEDKIGDIIRELMA